ncbi:MAG: hypothetical protein AABX73_04670 [Nanoarchaeota archaeon]
MGAKDTSEITTIKLNKKTKDRIDKLRLYNRESYDEIVQRILEILNLCMINPERAHLKLVSIERQKKKGRKKISLNPAELQRARA